MPRTDLPPGKTGRSLAVLIALSVLTAGCAKAPQGEGGGPAARSWAPVLQDAGGLKAVAQVQGGEYRLHTAHGDEEFLAGVNLGSTTPGRLPGELAIDRRDYRRWFPQMADLGIRSVRIYTIHPPEFYEELSRYNQNHPDAPIYLVQGVYMPDESYVESGNLYDPQVTRSFSAELQDAVAAAAGELQRDDLRGRADGAWTANVLEWTAAWIIGVEWDPDAVASTDERNAQAPAYQGQFFGAVDQATPTERWLAARMDETAAALAGRGWTAPVAFVNWPTTDPLEHPEEPLEQEDLAGVDASHVLPTEQWPGGSFASYHAYPYYPDFLRHEPSLQEFQYLGRSDPYAGYLHALREHHGPVPVMITETGVPSSIGTAHFGPLGRGQGAHSEQEAMQINSELLRLVHEVGLSGALLFEWTDEWFKHTWNTLPRHVPYGRRSLWHDPWTNEQYFGIVATDPAERSMRIVHESRDYLREVAVGVDEGWIHIRLRFDREPEDAVRLGFDVVEGGAERLPGSELLDGASDYAVAVDPQSGEASAWVRPELDPVALDLPEPAESRSGRRDGWQLHQLTVNRSLVIPTTGERLPAEFFDVGDLRRGVIDPDDPDYDSRATWQLQGEELHLRVPWLQIGISDPSSKQALLVLEDRSASSVQVDGVDLVIEAAGERTDTQLDWEGWQSVDYRERLKNGSEILARAFRDLAP